jgi:hypothetical protein
MRDAEKLARYARFDPNILRPISHRTVEQQEALTLIRARELLVRLPHSLRERSSRPEGCASLFVNLPM